MSQRHQEQLWPVSSNPLRSLDPAPAPEHATHIVVVAQDDQTRTLLQTMLEAGQYNVSVVVGGAADAEVAHMRQPDLVVLQMAQTDILEACTRLRQMPTMHEVPILVITPSDGFQEHEQLWAAGASDAIGQPLDPSFLLHRIDLLVQHARLESAYRSMATHIEAASHAFDQLPFPLLIVTTDGDIIKANTRWEQLGVRQTNKKKRNHTRNALAAWNSDLPKRLSAHQHDTTGRLIGGDLIIEQHGFSTIWHLSVCPLGRLADGRTLEFVVGANVTDIIVLQDQVKALEAAYQNAKAQPQMIAKVSHELRTPLHHIIGYVTTLQRHMTSLTQQEIADYLQIVVEESEQLAHVISELVIVSQLERGHTDFETFELDALIRSVVLRWNKNTTHRFMLDVPQAVPPIAGNMRRLRQVLDNILSNVVQHTPPNTSATIQLEVLPQELHVTITDDGPGVNPSHIPHLFAPFYQATSPQHTRGNIGLGLFIARTIVEQHGGSISADSQDGRGMTFRIVLPRRRGWKRL